VALCDLTHSPIAARMAGVFRLKQWA
jgi:hypothetical protein